jgi:hypothetical protein
MPDIYAHDNDIVVSEKPSLSKSVLLMHQTQTIYITFIEDHLSIIPVKFCENPTNG